MFKNKVYNVWDNIKAWFKRSETILIARLEILVGFMLAAVQGMDWSALMSLDFTNSVSSKEFLSIGGLVIAKGLISEWARRRNDPKLK